MDSPPSSSSQLHRFKVVLLGEGAVGKTSLILRYIENTFNAQHMSTLQASFVCKRLTIDGRRAELNIWDTAGQEKFHALGPIYYRESHGAILVYDITDAQSFDKVKRWVKELRRTVGENVVLVVVGNKTDAALDRQVTSSEARDYAESVRALYCETSAKMNEGVQELFLELTKKLLAEAVANPPTGNGRQRRNVLLVSDDDEVGEQGGGRKKCC